MMTVIPRFNMRRVFEDYTRGLYRPAAQQYRRLAAGGFAGARGLGEWQQRIRQAWNRVSLRAVADAPADLPRGEHLRMRVAVSLNGLQPSDVCVELVARRLLPEGEQGPPPLCSFVPPERNGLWRVPLTPTGEQEADGAAVFALDAEPPECGQFATEVRVYPRHDLLSHEYAMGMMKWL